MKLLKDELLVEEVLVPFVLVLVPTNEVYTMAHAFHYFLRLDKRFCWFWPPAI